MSVLARITPHDRRSTTFAVAALVAVVAVVVTLIVVLRGGDDDVRPPYSDPAATGVLGLCDRAGQPVRSGSTSTGPFVWRAVGASAASGPYRAVGATATLFAFQPRSGVDPSGWSGRELTASSRYSDPGHPMAQSTADDATLLSFLTAYPARQSGFVQLRLYLGAPGQPLSTQRYDATDIRVTGSTWTVVRGGDVDCTAGTATSLESDVRPTSTPSR